MFARSMCANSFVIFALSQNQISGRRMGRMEQNYTGVQEINVPDTSNCRYGTVTGRDGHYRNCSSRTS